MGLERGLEARRESIASVLGTFLSALHARAGDDLDLPGDDLARLDMNRRMPMLDERLTVLTRRSLVDDARPWIELVGDPTRYDPVQPVIVHGDLYAAHLLFGGSGKVTGVIDWGDVHLGDPAVDLSVRRGSTSDAVRSEVGRGWPPLPPARA